MDVRFSDGRERPVYCDVPALPAGITWHTGMIFDCDDLGWIEVENVVFHQHDGQVTIWLQTQEDDRAFSEDAISDWCNDTWRRKPFSA
jgi:hypothetical protein